MFSNFWCRPKLLYDSDKIKSTMELISLQCYIIILKWWVIDIWLSKFCDTVYFMTDLLLNKSLINRVEMQAI